MIINPSSRAQKQLSEMSRVSFSNVGKQLILPPFPSYNFILINVSILAEFFPEKNKPHSRHSTFQLELFGKVISN